MTAAVAVARPARSWMTVLARWETLLVVAIAGLIVLGTVLSPFFLSAGNFANLIAAVVVGGVNIFGGSGTVIGAAIGAYFLGFVANALILVGLSQFWLQAIYGLVILLAISADALILRRLQRATAARRVR